MITTFKTQVYLKKTANPDKLWQTLKDWRCASKNTPEDIKKEMTAHNRAPENMHFTSKNGGFIETKKYAVRIVNIGGFILWNRMKKTISGIPILF